VVSSSNEGLVRLWCAQRLAVDMSDLSGTTVVAVRINFGSSQINPCRRWKSHRNFDNLSIHRLRDSEFAHYAFTNLGLSLTVAPRSTEALTEMQMM
jgi:hypothetical protein